MGLRLAIQPDVVVHPNGTHQSFSERWAAIAPSYGAEVVPVDVFTPDPIASIADCDGFLWRCASSAHPRVYARRLINAVEAGLGIPCFPSARATCYYEDKLAQHQFLTAAGIPHAGSRICWSREAAERYCDGADFPFVVKLAGGHQSRNVRLARSRKEAQFYIDELFGHGVTALNYRPAGTWRRLLRHARAVAECGRGRYPHAPNSEAELEFGYLYTQEFLRNNRYEVSVIVIGNRAFAVRRFVVPGDFRTRGSSGRMDWDPQAIREADLRLALLVAGHLGDCTIAVDILHRGSDPVVIELTLNYASWVVEKCPGHWLLKGDPTTGTLTWVPGQTRAEDAVFEEFLTRVRHAKADEALDSGAEIARRQTS